MSLREQMYSDRRNVFFNTDEHATVEEFRINNGQGGFTVFNATVIHDTDQLKRLATTRMGVYQGDELLYIMHEDLPRRPLAGELIYSPANKPLEVMECHDEEGVWVLLLSSTRSQPAHYGGN
jgi:hypothetical protein